MRSIFNNRIFRTGLLGFFVLAVFIVPVSLRLNLQDPTSLSISLTKNDVSAAAPLLLAGGAAAAAAAGAVGIDWVVDKIGETFLGLSAFLSWVGGLFLESALKYTVFEMGKIVHSGSPMGGTIINIWSLIRDICNLAFIFGFIYIGIRTIIDPDSATMKRFLSRIIIGALLINFSLFFAKAIIDFSNFTAWQIYTSMTSGGGSISETLVHNLKLVTIYDTSTGKILQSLQGKAFSFYFFSGLLLLITAFTFFAAALILVVRFVALVLLMVASPLLFAATVFPQTEHVAKDLWHKLVSYSLLAPVYLLLVLISIKTIEGLNTAIPSGNVAQTLLDPKNNDFSVVLNFTVIIFFMISSLMIATKMGGKGGEMAVGLANNLRGRMQGVVGRKLVGGTSHWAREKYEKMDANLGNMKGRLAPLGKAAQWTLGATGADRTIRETFQAGEHAKFGSKYSYEDDEKYDKERGAREGRIIELKALEEAIKKSQAPGATPDDLVKMERAVSGASNEQVLNLLKEFKEDSNEYKALVANMTSSQFDALMKLKEDELNDAKKGKLGSVRAEAVERRLIANTPGAVNISDAIGKASSKDLDALSHETLENNAAFLNIKQIDDLTKTPTEKTRLKDKRKADLITLSQLPGGVGMQTIFARFKEDEIAKLPDSILTDPAAVPHFNAKILSKILDNDSITGTVRNQIKANVINARGGNAFNNFFNTPRGQNF